MSTLNENQFAKYSALHNPNYENVFEPSTLPLPASMERHAPGEYQPTLPGMEKMIPGEMSHADVFFKHPSAADPDLGDVEGSKWGDLRHTPGKDAAVSRNELHPSQEWMDDNYLHSPPHPKTLEMTGKEPKVEYIGGANVIHDGHHRAVREMLQGNQFVNVKRWGAPE